MAKFYSITCAVALYALATSCAGEASIDPELARHLRGGDDTVRGFNIASPNNDPGISYPVSASQKYYFIVGANSKTTEDSAMGPGVVAKLFNSTDWSNANLSFPESNSKDYLLNISVAVDDSGVAVVGSPNYENGGVVAVYAKDEGEWDLLQALKPPSACKSKFGFSVDVSGSRIIVGDGGENAFIFDRQGSNGQFQLATTLKAGGGKVAIQDDVVIVGYKEVQGGPMALVYQLSNTGIWEEVYAPVCPDCVSDKDQGFDVAISNTSVVVSTYVLVNATEDKWAGYIYVLAKDKAGSWYLNGTLTSGHNDNFGKSVATVGACVLVGIPYPAPPVGGAADYFAWFRGEWTNMGGPGASGFYFAEFVAIGGDGSAEFPYTSYISVSRYGDVFFTQIDNNDGYGVCSF